MSIAAAANNANFQEIVHAPPGSLNSDAASSMALKLSGLHYGRWLAINQQRLQ